MSYPPPHNGQYPPQYLQQPQHHQPHPQPSQYNVSPNAPYPQYGKPMLYPQVLIPAYPAYGQQHQQPQYHHQQQQQQQQQPLPRQYVSPPSTSFQPQAPPSHYVHGHPSPTPQYGGRAATSPAVPVTGHAPSPALPPSPYYSISSPSMPNAYGQYPAAAQVSSPTRPQPRPATQPQPASSAASPASAPAPQQIPQVVIPARPPASSPEVPQKMPAKAPAKKQLQRLQSQPSVEKESKLPIDYQVLLLALADEYFNAAHSKGTMVALQRREMEMEEYYKLVATGLGCLEAVLKNWRLQPRTEALVRLRYARILFEETDNDIEAETALSKGIDLCDRNRMLDLKYSMQQLLARLLHKSNPKAAMKAVDGMIQDVEAYRHIAWEYAFRLLRVTLSLSSSSHQDFVAALHNLHRISNLANRNRDKAVSVISAVTEALAHLQQSTSSDSIEQAQRALAIARSHQLDDEVRDIPQISTLIQMVDISCSLLEYDINQSAQKLQIMQTLMDQKINDPHWRDDGSFSIPLNGKSVGPSSADTGDILQVENGTLVLTLNWLPQHDLYALCYFLSSVTMSAKNSHDGRKAEKYLEEGLRMIRGSFKAPQEIAESLVTAGKRIEWRRILYCNMLLQRIFLTASRTDWEQASQALKELRQAAKELGDNLPDTIQCLMEYAAGTIAQGTGDLTGALSAFQSPILRLSSSASKTSRNDPRRDTAILAALNTVLILRDPKHPMHFQLPSILSTVESFCKGSPNKYIQAAYYLVCATVQTDSTIQTKQYLQQALQSATAISNSQITCMTLTFMSWKYFRGVVGEQSEKSARAGRAMAKRANDRLWVSVTDEMLAETLERQGKGEEARSVREEGRRVMMGLPPALKKAEVN